MNWEALAQAVSVLANYHLGNYVLFAFGIFFDF